MSTLIIGLFIIGLNKTNSLINYTEKNIYVYSYYKIIFAINFIFDIYLIGAL